MNAFIQITSSGDQVSPHWTDVHRVDLVFEQSPTTWLQHLSRSLLVSFWSQPSTQVCVCSCCRVIRLGSFYCHFVRSGRAGKSTIDASGAAPSLDPAESLTDLLRCILKVFFFVLDESKTKQGRKQFARVKNMQKIFKNS